MSANIEAIRARLAGRWPSTQGFLPSGLGSPDDDIAALLAEVDRLRTLCLDVARKATPYGEQDGGFVASYILPTGPLHRIFAAFPGSARTEPERELDEIERLTAQRDAALKVIADASDIGDGWAQELLYDLRSALGVTE